jgi:hypothetical protein
MNPADCNQWDAIAEAALKIWKGGRLELVGAVLVGIVFWRKPWFRDAGKT